MIRKPLSRRAMLCGAGVAIALPWLEAMMPRRAHAGNDFPVRFMTFYVPNGIYMQKWTPTDTGSSYTLPPMLSALAPLKADFQILSNLGNPAAIGPVIGDHSVGASALLTVHHPKVTTGADVAAAISIDQIIANAWSGRTRMPSLEVGSVLPANDDDSAESTYSGAYLRHLAWAGPQLPLPKELVARDAFILLFGGSDVPPLKGKSILDYVMGQASDLNNRLGSTDRQKLDEYLSSVRDVESRLNLPPPPASADSFSADRTQLPAQTQSMLDVITLALQTDATRVITYMFGNAKSDAIYSFLGLTDTHHDISHHNGDPVKLAEIEVINTWEIQQLAYLLTKMKSIQEGEGTLLDNSIVYFTSEIGDGSTHSHVDLPILVAGHAGGAFPSSGHTNYPSNPPIANLYATFLQALDVPYGGTLNGQSVTPLPGLT